MEYVKEMQKYIDVDIYGRSGKKCPGPRRANNDPRFMLKHFGVSNCVGDKFEQYRFYIAFENFFCKDYVTEKCFRPFVRNSSVIAVARGGMDYDAMLPSKSFINAALGIAETNWTKLCVQNSGLLSTYFDNMDDLDLECRGSVPGHHVSEHGKFATHANFVLFGDTLLEGQAAIVQVFLLKCLTKH